MEDLTCPNGLHNAPMTKRDMTHATYEQKFCGDWYDCEEPGCTASILIPSKELEAHLESMKVKV